jgi:predicted peroxiredoxin
MANLLIHIHSGPELENKLTLGLLVAKTGVAEGHSVKLFLAADAVHALNCRAEGEIVGQGTGDANLHLQALATAGVQIMVSGMSAKARGYNDSLLAGYNASFAMPDKLIALALEADTVLCY